MNAKRWIGVGAAVLLTAAGVSRSYATGTAGLLDGGFGTGGVVLQPVPTGSSIEVVARQSTGKLVAARHVEGALGAGTTSWSFRRYAVDGSLDTSFGSAGEKLLFGTDGDVLRDMVIDRFDRIVAVGRTKGTTTAATIARLGADGSLDGSFGTSGVARIAMSGAPLAQAVAIQADDRLVVAGSFRPTAKKNPNRAQFVLRTTSSGALDSTFGTGGVAVNNVSSFYDDVYPGAIAIQSSGHIVVGGRNTGNQNWILTRFHANGAVDGTFGTVTRPAFLRGITLDASDRILVCGWAANPSPLVLARYLSSGTPDSSFGVGGIATASASAHVEATAVRTLADGRTVVTATLGASTGSHQATAVRFLGNGTVDADFGSGGFATPVGEAGIDYYGGIGAVVDSSGNVLTVGERQKSTNPRSTHVFLVRWLGN